MRGSRGVLAVVSLVMLLAAVAGADAPYREEIDETHPLAVNGSVSLENVNGDVSIEVWDRDAVRVVAVKEASSQERMDAMTVDIDAGSDAIRIETRYRKHERGHWDRHTFWSDRGHSEVEYTLTVPRLARLDGIDLVNGSLVVIGVDGDVNAECVNGSIRVQEATGDIDLSTVNGGIELYYDDAEPVREVELESVNGGIELILSPSSSAFVRAETVNGRISNDFGLEVKKGRYVGASMRGDIGGGGAEIRMETVNGGITVRDR